MLFISLYRYIIIELSKLGNKVHENLSKEMKKFNISNSELAEKLNISEKELEMKITGKKSFRLNEALIIKNFLSLKISSLEYLFK